MRRPTRPSGLTILGDMPWGTHMCLFYETEQDLIDAMVPYLQAGLEGNEFCIWAVGKPLTVEAAYAALDRNIIGLSRYREAGQIEIVPAHDWYHTRDLNKVVEDWHEKLDDAVAQGFSGLRAGGDSFWFEARHRDEFLAYEEKLDASLADRPMLVLCTYPLLASSAADMIDVAHTHELAAALRRGKWECIAATEHPTTHSLTLREIEVLSWVARGKSAWEIGKILGISKRTADEHASSAARKLGAANRTEATVIALRRRIIELDDAEGHVAGH